MRLRYERHRSERRECSNLESCSSPGWESTRRTSWGPSKRVALAFAMGLALLVVPPSVDQAQTSEYATPNFDPKHSFSSIIPEETVDLFTGALILSYTDVHLPGPAGFDLDIVRWYNSKINVWDANCLTVTSEETYVGIGWQMHLGRLWDNPANPVPQRQAAYRLELPGGETREFYGQPNIPVPTGALVSKDFWILKENVSIGGVQHHVVTSPAGVEYRFKTGAPNPVENNYLYLTSKVDPIGNTIQVTYRSVNQDRAYPEVVTDALGRTVTFVYGTTSLNDPDPLQKIRVKNTAGQVVEYLYEVGGPIASSGHQALLGFTTPTGLTTSYDYTPRTGEVLTQDVELKKATFPTGQTIEYFYQDHNFEFPLRDTGNGTECTRIVHERRVAGVGSWFYTFPSGSPTDDTTIVTDPLSNIERATFARYAATGTDKIWKVGLLTRREIEDASDGVVRTEDYTYNPFVVSTWNVCPKSGCTETLQAALLVDQRITSTGGGTSKTAKVLIGDHDNYGNPGFVEEYDFNNLLVREQDFLYAHTGNSQWNPTTLYIVDRPEQITVKDASQVVRKDTKFTYYTSNTSPGAKGQVETSEEWANAVSDFATGAKWLATDFEYDGDGNVSKTTEASTTGNRVTTFTHQWGSLQSASDGEGTIFTRVINQHTGLITSQTDPNANTTFFQYDAMGRMTLITPPTGSTTAISYDNLHATSVTVTRGSSETRYQFDGLGRQVLTRRLLTASPLTYAYNRIEYDPLGRVKTAFEAAFADPSGSAPGERTTFDALGRVRSRQDPDGTTTFSYGPDTATSTDPFTHTKTSKTDALGRLIQVVDEAGLATSYGYDVNDELVSVDHPGGSNPDRSIAANSLGWVLHELHPESGLTRYAYDDFGELTQKTDAAARSMSMTYDARGRLKATAYANGPTITQYYDGDAVPGTGSIAYLNPLGNRTGLVDSVATTLWTDHDDLNRPTAKKTIVAGRTFLESVTFDSRGNLASRNYPQEQADPTTRMSVSFTPNEGNKVAAALLNGTTTLFSQALYSPAYRIRELTLGNGVRVERPTSAALRNRPDLIRTVGATSSSGAANDLTFDYSWDALGRVGSILTNGRLDTYAYDVRGQVQSAAFGSQGSVTYGYDNTGNMTTRTSAAFPQLNFSRSHTNNRINGLSYDAAGNLLGDGGNSYAYDATGRLSTVTTAQGQVVHQYDGEGRRRITQKPGGVTELLFYSDTGELISKFQVPASGAATPIEDVVYLEGERIVTRRYPELSDPGETLDVDENGTDVVLTWGVPQPCGGSVNVRRATIKDFSNAGTIASGLFATTYSDSGQATVMDKKFYRIEGPKPTLHYHVNDHLGSTRMVIDEAGVVEASYEYFPFGETKAETCSPLNGGFQGKERDVLTGLDDMGLRSYSASQGRFLQPDKAAASIDVTRPHSWNRYLLSLNDPLRYVDPDGGSWKHWARAGVSGSFALSKRFTPVGNVIDAVLDVSSAAVGVDLITGDDLSSAERALYVAGAALPFVGGKELARGGRWLGLIDDAGADKALERGLVNGAARGVEAALVGEARIRAVIARFGARLPANVAERFRPTQWGEAEIDLIGRAGELIEVGGAAKGMTLEKLSHFGNQLKKLRAAAEAAGTKAQFYYDSNTTEPALRMAKKWLGSENVIPMN